MASVLEMTNEGTPSPREPFVFPSYGNIGPPHIATLSLPGLMIGFLMWLFSTQVISNVVSEEDQCFHKKEKQKVPLEQSFLHWSFQELTSLKTKIQSRVL